METTCSSSMPIPDSIPLCYITECQLNRLLVLIVGALLLVLNWGVHTPLELCNQQPLPTSLLP